MFSAAGAASATSGLTSTYTTTPTPRTLHTTSCPLPSARRLARQVNPLEVCSALQVPQARRRVVCLALQAQTILVAQEAASSAALVPLGVLVTQAQVGRSVRMQIHRIQEAREAHQVVFLARLRIHRIQQAQEIPRAACLASPQTLKIPEAQAVHQAACLEAVLQEGVSLPTLTIPEAHPHLRHLEPLASPRPRNLHYSVRPLQQLRAAVISSATHLLPPLVSHQPTLCSAQALVGQPASPKQRRRTPSVLVRNSLLPLLLVAPRPQPRPRACSEDNNHQVEGSLRRRQIRHQRQAVVVFLVKSQQMRHLAQHLAVVCLVQNPPLQTTHQPLVPAIPLEASH